LSSAVSSALPRWDACVILMTVDITEVCQGGSADSKNDYQLSV